MLKRANMDSLTCVWKKSVSQDYGVISIQSIDGCTIEWLRCMTCKEALKKVETGGNIPVAVIEDSREKDIDLISDMIRAGVKVILLGGSQVVAGAISMATLGELSEWLERFIKGGLDITQNEVNKELEEPIEASDTPLVDSLIHSIRVKQHPPANMDRLDIATLNHVVKCRQCHMQHVGYLST